MLGQRRIRWANIKATLVYCLLSAEWVTSSALNKWKLSCRFPDGLNIGKLYKQIKYQLQI